MALGEAFAARGLTVLRYDLPFRQASRTAPPRPAGAARDREGLRQAVAAMRLRLGGRVFLGGESDGRRQARKPPAGAGRGFGGRLFFLHSPYTPRRPAGPPPREPLKHTPPPLFSA